MWAFVKRILLFSIVNILVLATITLVFHILTAVFGIELSGFSQLLVLYGMFGMGGALISLAISRMMAKMILGVKVIAPSNSDPVARQLVEIVHGLARRARLPVMPEVGIYDSDEVNAFATGPTKSRSLVAVSTGLLRRMNPQQVEGVLGHEITHIANGDMVTMTLIQGVVNTMVLLLARLIAVAVTSNMEEREARNLRWILEWVFQIVLNIFGTMVVMAFSRRREFRADAGGAKLAGRDKMINALKALAPVYGVVDDAHPAMATLKISGHSQSLLASLFSSHPPLTVRIQRLERMQVA